MADDKKIIWPGWETVQLIGSGSFGAVYEIQRDMFGDIEKAALKVITIPQNSSDIEEMYSDGYDEESITNTFKSHLRSIVAEYSLMRKLNGCTNIVNCDDVRYVQHDDGIGWDIFIKMELLTPLPKALPAEITEELVIKIAKDMCCALELCKKYEIVHRDIKPQNIFVSPNGDYKLGDFGIAKTVEKTMGGTKIGTYKYMAPEVYNNEPYGSGADIYSLGLVLYWLLNERRMPFLPLPPEKLKAGMDEAARTRRLSGDSIPSPAHGSEGLKQVVLKACAYDVKDRYESAAEMLMDLKRLADAGEVIANKGQVNVEIEEDEQTVSIFQAGIEITKAKPTETVNVGEWTVGLVAEQDSKPIVVETERESDGTICLFGDVKVVDEEKVDDYHKKGFDKKLLWGIGGGLVVLVVVFIYVFGGMNKGDEKKVSPINSLISTTERPVETKAPAMTKAPATSVEDVQPVSAKITGQNVRIRLEASLQGSIVTTVLQGTMVTVNGRVQGGDGHIWYRVCYISDAGEAIGFIRNDLLSVSDEIKTVETDSLATEIPTTIVTPAPVETTPSEPIIVRDIAWVDINAEHTYDSSNRLTGFLLQAMFRCTPENYDGFEVGNSLGAIEGHKPFYIDTIGWEYCYFSFWIPNDPMLEGWQTVTIYHDGTSETVNVYLEYLGDYSHMVGTSNSVEGLGWRVAEWNVAE